MNPDRRAEIGPSETVANPHRNVHLPRWLRNPTLAARLTLATLTGLGAVAVDHMTSPIVTAQTVCKGQLTVLGIKFADHPNLGRNRIVDPTDFYLGNGDFNVVEIYDAAGKIKFDAWDGKDSAKKPKPIASSNMSDRGTHSIARVAFSGECDENQQGLAKRVWLTFPLDTDRTIYPEVVGNNTLRVHIAGRNERRITELQGVANNGNFPIEKVGEVIARITKKLGTPVSFTAPEQLKGDAKTISEANRISLRAQIAKLIKEQEESRREEEKKAQKASPTTPAATPTAGGRDLQQEQKENFDKLAQQLKGLRDAQDETNRQLTDIKGRLAVTVTVPTTSTVPAAGIGLPDLSGVKETPLLGGIVQTLDLPAKVLDQVTEPDTQPPLRAGIDILAWLVFLRLLKRVPKVGIVGIPGAYILGSFSYPFRFGIAKWRYNRAVATAAAAVPPGVAPAWTRPTLPI